MGEVERWDEEHGTDIEAGQGPRGQYRLEPPTHRSFRGNDKRAAPQAIPHLGPMLETTIGPTSRSSRGGTISPVSTPTSKTAAQMEPDTSKGFRRPSKRQLIFLGVVFFLAAFHWLGLTITFKQNVPPPTMVPTQQPQDYYTADYED